MNTKNKITIEKLDDKGRGIGYTNNKIIFIPNTLIGEIVTVNITKETTKYYVGEVIEYIKKNDERKLIPCPYYNKCGGCNLLHMDYKNSIKYKHNKLKNILNKFSNIDNDIEIIENKNIFNYRNKIELKVLNKKWGYYNSNTHSFISINNCLLAKESINTVLNNKQYINFNNGNIIIRSNYNDEILIIINTETKPDINIDKLKKVIKLVGIIINDELYYGEKFFIEKYNNLYFKVNYNSFFQINEYITNKIIEILNDFISGNNLLDLYCGVGFLGLSINNKFNKIYGIEINENSILDAIYNSKLNKINNTHYICSSSSNVIDKIKDNIDTIIVDPPRSGLVGNTINDILNINAKSLIYISCDPITLSRDINILKEYYKVNKIYLLDMFSNTYHFETIVFMNKKN